MAQIDMYRNALSRKRDELVKLKQEDKVSGKATLSMYDRLMPKYETEMKEKEIQLKEVTAELSAVPERTSNAENWAALIKQYRNVSELSRELITNLIQKIEIGEPVMVDEQKEREIRIHYKFVGFIG